MAYTFPRPLVINWLHTPAFLPRQVAYLGPSRRLLEGCDKKWGVRAAEDISVGSFVCTVAGQVGTTFCCGDAGTALRAHTFFVETNSCRVCAACTCRFAYTLYSTPLLAIRTARDNVRYFVKHHKLVSPAPFGKILTTCSIPPIDASLLLQLVLRSEADGMDGEDRNSTVLVHRFRPTTADQHKDANHLISFLSSPSSSLPTVSQRSGEIVLDQRKYANISRYKGMSIGEIWWLRKGSTYGIKVALHNRVPYRTWDRSSSSDAENSSESVPFGNGSRFYGSISCVRV